MPSHHWLLVLVSSTLDFFIKDSVNEMLSEYIGVYSLDSTPEEFIYQIKKYSLIFDKIAIPLLDHRITNSSPRIKQSYSKLEWFLERNIIFDSSIIIDNPSIIDKIIENSNSTLQYDTRQCIEGWFKEIEEAENILLLKKNIERRIENEKPDFNTRIALWEPYVSRMVPNLEKFFEFTGRLESLGLSERHNCTAVPILNRTITGSQVVKQKKGAVINIILDALPTPDPNVTWNELLEFRKDPEIKLKFFALRNWVNEVSRGDLSQSEIFDKLQWLTEDYKRHLRLHKKKIKLERMEIVAVTTAETIENIIKLKLGKATEALFRFRKRKLHWIESEIKLPGSEIAYIVDAAKHFK